ncbi:MAG: hypothetical protein QXD77_03305 [Candidatus Aenigmatarchaeota archaeon]
MKGVDRQALLSVTKSIAYTVMITVVLIIAVDWLNLVLTGEVLIDPWKVTLFLLRPEVIIAIILVAIGLAIFMLKSLSE